MGGVEGAGLFDVFEQGFGGAHARSFDAHKFGAVELDLHQLAGRGRGRAEDLELQAGPGRIGRHGGAGIAGGIFDRFFDAQFAQISHQQGRAPVLVRARG